MLCITTHARFDGELLLQPPYVVLQVLVLLELALDVLDVALELYLAVVGLLELLAEGVEFHAQVSPLLFEILYLLLQLDYLALRSLPNCCSLHCVRRSHLVSSYLVLCQHLD